MKANPMKDVVTGSVWERSHSGQLSPERITVVTVSEPGDTFGRVFVTFRTESGTGSFYGVPESWHAQFDLVPSE